MEDKLSRFIKLFGLLLMSFLLVIAFLVLIMLGLRLFFDQVGNMPWMTWSYRMLILSLPTAVMTTAYVIFIRRTGDHPSSFVRWISYFLIGAAALWMLISFAMDVVAFVREPVNTITSFLSYNKYLLAGHVSLLFFTGVLQALTTEKEKDWMDR
jgi:hypothetical protein